MRIWKIKKKGFAAQMCCFFSALMLVHNAAFSVERPGGDPADMYKVVPQVCKPAKGKFAWNFDGKQLDLVLSQVSDFLCRTIIMNAGTDPNQKINVIGKSFLTPSNAWDLVQRTLAYYGMTLVGSGDIWTVAKMSDSKNLYTPIYTSSADVENNENRGLLLYTPRNISKDSIRDVAKLLVTKDGSVETSADHIFVFDTNNNIRRIGVVFEQIDVEDDAKINIFKLQHADAKTAEKQIRDLLDIPTGSAGRTRRSRSSSTEGKSGVGIDKIIADERTNSLIITCDKDSVSKINEIIAVIDQPDSTESSKGKIHVKHLRYVDAKQVAETLNNVVSQGRNRRRFSRGPSGDDTSGLFEGEVKITAHEDNNKIVIVATPGDFRAISAIIDELDSRKPQVYIEAVIMDINLTGGNDFGIGLFSGLEPSIPGIGSGLGMMANPGGAGIATGISKALASGTGATNIEGLGKNSVGALAVLSNFLSGGVFGIVGNSGNSQIPTFGAVLTALQKSSSVDVLSTPSLLTTDNQEAVMSVGSKIPVIKGASSVGGAGSLGVPMQNISHEDVKLTFKITPHVGADNNIRLDIDQEVNEIGTKTEIFGQPQYSINTKSAKTTIVLKDQQTGVIGGLIGHKSGTAESKIPFLGDIPLLGWLFKTRSTSTERRSLVLVVTAYTLRTDDDYKKIYDRKMKEREEFARLYYGGKIKNYDKYIDYDKKTGPLSSLILSIDADMKMPENGGAGTGNETIITPKNGTPEAQGIKSQGVVFSGSSNYIKTDKEVHGDVLNKLAPADENQEKDNLDFFGQDKDMKDMNEATLGG